MMAAAQQARGMEFPRPVPLERITPERAALAKEANDRFGIPVYGPENAAHQVAKQRALARAASRTIGEDAPALTAEVMNAARLRIGGPLQRIEQSHDVRFDTNFRGDMIAISNDARSQLTTPGQIRVVDKHLKDVMVDPVKTEAAKQATASAPKTPGKPAPKPKEVLRNGLSGQQFGNLMHQDGPIAKFADNTDPGVAQFGERTETALRDLFQRQLPADRAAEYQGLRYQWKNLRTIEKAVGPTGELDPGRLNTAVGKSFPRRAYDKSAPLVKLSDIANEFVGKPGAGREGFAASYLAPAAGYLADHFVGGPLGGVAGHMAAHRVAHAAVNAMSRPRLTEALINRALAQLPPPGARRNAINAMMSARGANTLTEPQITGNALANLARMQRQP